MTVTVLGAGTWGTALARLLCRNGHAVTLWSALPRELDALRADHAHPNLPGMVFPQSVALEPDLAACAGAGMVVFAVPSVFVRSTARAAAPHLGAGALLVDVAKGVEDGTLLTMAEVIEQELAAAGRGGTVAALSGPTHAEEVARDLPTAIVAGCADGAVAAAVQVAFNGPNFRVYTNPDRRGVELGGAVKNVLALAVGMARGLGYGDNAQAALITRGSAELTRLGLAMGCRPATFAGLSGIGDLIVTCTSLHSRNLRAGMLMGQGMSAEQARREVGQVVEGINALPAALRLAETCGVEMPIVQAVGEILAGRLTATDAVAALMGREPKPE